MHAENALEQYFRQENICYSKIPESDTKTPDYEILSNGNRIIAEFKEFVSTNKNKQLFNRKVFTLALPLGMNRIRDKLKECSRQFKEYSGYSCLCVLRNTGGDSIDLSTRIITMAMHGNIFFSISVDIEGKLPAIEEGFKYGRNAPPQISRKESGSLISAVAILEKIYPNQKNIDRNLDDLYQESKERKWDKKKTLEKASEKIEKIKESNPNINFDEFKWRLRIIHNPYAKIEFATNTFGGKWNEDYIYQNGLGYKKL